MNLTSHLCVIASSAKNSCSLLRHSKNDQVKRVLSTFLFKTRANLVMSSQTAKLRRELDELKDKMEQRNRRLADASRTLEAYEASRDKAHRAHLRYLNIVNNYGQPASSYS